MQNIDCKYTDGLYPKKSGVGLFFFVAIAPSLGGESPSKLGACLRSRMDQVVVAIAPAPATSRVLPQAGPPAPPLGPVNQVAGGWY